MVPLQMVPSNVFRERDQAGEKEGPGVTEGTEDV